MNNLKQIIVVIILFSTPFLTAQTIEERLLKAFHTQEALKYEEAIEQYESLIAEGYFSADLYFNMAMAFYDKGELGNAILYLEKAKRQDPGNEAVSSNLTLLENEQIDGLIPLPKFFLKAWWDRAAAAFNPNTWAILAILFSVLSAVSLGLWSLKKMVNWRKYQLFLSLALGVLALLIFFLGQSRLTTLSQNNEAIITASTLDFYIAPGEDADKNGQLNTGLKVAILDQFEGWMKIRLLDGREGWVKREGVGVI